MSFLVLEKLTKTYGDQHAVDSLSLGVEQGEFLALLGPSGCGKTTTLQMIAGFVEPTAGGISLDGRDLRSIKSSRRGLGLVFQSYALFPHMTVAENVAFGLEMQSIPKPDRERRVQEALELVGLDQLGDRYPRRLSGGQQQRVALARALVIRPKVLLLDEPLSNLDAKLREEMQIELRHLHRAVGATTILVTHDQAEAMALSDRIAVMNQGRVEQIGAPFDVYERPSTAFVAGFLGKTNVLPASMLREGSGIYAEIGSGRWPVKQFLADRIVASVRPEKIDFASSGSCCLAGRVRTRIFQGTHWLYQIETAAGTVIVIRQNSGEAVPAEGAAVSLNWRPSDMSIRVASGSHG